MGRHIAEDAAQARGEFESLGPLAFWALDLSLLYVAGWGLVLLCPRRVDTPPGVPATLLITAVVGQAAACLAGGPVGFYFLAAGIPMVSLIVPYLEPEPRNEPRPRIGRLVTVCMLGLVVVLLASPIDSGLASLTGAGLLPEAWFPVAVEFASGRSLAIAITLALVVAAACASLGFTRSSWLHSAPAFVLVLGPSNPAKGLAAALVVALLGRLGAGPFWRAGFLVVMTALFVVVALRT